MYNEIAILDFLCQRPRIFLFALNTLAILLFASGFISALFIEWLLEKDEEDT